MTSGLSPWVRSRSGVVAIGKLALGEGRIKKLVIDELEVGVLRVGSIANLPSE